MVGLLLVMVGRASKKDEFQFIFLETLIVFVGEYFRVNQQFFSHIVTARLNAEGKPGQLYLIHQRILKWLSLCFSVTDNLQAFTTILIQEEHIFCNFVDCCLRNYCLLLEFESLLQLCGTDISIKKHLVCKMCFCNNLHLITLNFIR